MLEEHSLEKSDSVQSNTPQKWEWPYKLSETKNTLRVQKKTETITQAKVSLRHYTNSKLLLKWGRERFRKLLEHNECKRVKELSEMW